MRIPGVKGFMPPRAHKGARTKLHRRKMSAIGKTAFAPPDQATAFAPPGPENAALAPPMMPT